MPEEFSIAPKEPLAQPDYFVGTPLKPVGKFELERLTSLDVFRGITIAAMLLVNNPGSWAHKYEPLGHAEWHGWTPTDLIFPFFLFIVGVAIPFSFGKRSTTESRGMMLAHIWARALSLVLLGLLLGSFSSKGWETLWPEGYALLGILRWTAVIFVPLCIVLLLIPWWPKKVSLLLPPIVAVLLLGLGFAIHYSNRSALAAGFPAGFELGNGLLKPSLIRFPGVLQRIGVCYGVAATIALLTGWRTVLLSLLLVCGIYSAPMLKAPFSDHEVGSLTMKDNFARHIDETVFDRFEIDAAGKRVAKAKHTYGEYPDPEGLVSTLPAIGSVLLGILVGFPLRSTNRTNAEKCARLLANGVLVTIAGVLLSWWLMPINKKIWTPSFAVFSAGMGMLTLGAVFYLTDVKGRRAWAWPFKVYGMNAIAAFVFAGLVGRVGGMIKIHDPWLGKDNSVIQFCKDRVRDAVTSAGIEWHKLLPNFPPLNTDNNQSLAWALTFVLATFLLMLILYVSKIFLKV